MRAEATGEVKRRKCFVSIRLTSERQPCRSFLAASHGFLSKFVAGKGHLSTKVGCALFQRMPQAYIPQVPDRTNDENNCFYKQSIMASLPTSGCGSSELYFEASILRTGRKCSSLEKNTQLWRVTTML